MFSNSSLSLPQRYRRWLSKRRNRGQRNASTPFVKHYLCVTYMHKQFWLKYCAKFLQYGTSDYVSNAGMNIANQPMQVQGRILPSMSIQYRSGELVSIVRGSTHLSEILNPTLARPWRKVESIEQRTTCNTLGAYSNCWLGSRYVVLVKAICSMLRFSSYFWSSILCASGACVCQGISGLFGWSR